MIEPQSTPFFLAVGRAALGLLADCLRLCKLNYTAETLAAEMACDLVCAPLTAVYQQVLSFFYF